MKLLGFLDFDTDKTYRWMTIPTVLSIAHPCNSTCSMMEGGTIIKWHVFDPEERLLRWGHKVVGIVLEIDEENIKKYEETVENQFSYSDSQYCGIMRLIHQEMKEVATMLPIGSRVICEGVGRWRFEESGEYLVLPSHASWRTMLCTPITDSELEGLF